MALVANHPQSFDRARRIHAKIVPFDWYHRLALRSLISVLREAGLLTEERQLSAEFRGATFVLDLNLFIDNRQAMHRRQGLRAPVDL